MKQLKPQFVTTPHDQGSLPQTVQKVSSLETYLTKFVDGAGKEDVRIVLKVPNSDTLFMLSDAVGGQKIVKNTSEWFRKGFATALKDSRNKGDAESI